MRRITVKAYEKAMVFKNGRLITVLSEGKHWIGWRRTIKRYDVTELFYQEMELDLLLQNSIFATLVDVKTVKDNEILLQYKDGIFKKVLTSGRYCYWKEGKAYTYKLIDLNSLEVTADIDRKVMNLPAVRYYLTDHVIESYEKGLLYVDGKFERELEAGMYYFWKGAQAVVIKKVDLRTQQVEVSGQELLTKDKAAVRINFFATYDIKNVMKAIDETKDYARQLYIMIQLGLREYLGQYTLDELLANKVSAGPYILNYVAEQAVSIGIEMKTCGIRDIILPGDIKEIMNQVLIAEKKAQANVIMRREETASTRSLLNTAKLMEGNEMLFRLKEMEYIEKISEKVGEITVNGGSQVMDQLRGLVSN